MYSVCCCAKVRHLVLWQEEFGLGALTLPYILGLLFKCLAGVGVGVCMW